MNERHLSDDRLIEICVSGSGSPAERVHLVGCAKCELRRASVVEILRELDEAATLEADTAFPPDRLERQQARIFQRIELDGRPGRVISFPAHQPVSALLLRSRPHARWAAAAAAAAFVVGLMAGHLVNNLPLGDEPSVQLIANEPDPAPPRAVSTTFSEDEFLGQIELAAAMNGPAALRALDAITPRAWEVR